MNYNPLVLRACDPNFKPKLRQGHCHHYHYHHQQQQQHDHHGYHHHHHIHYDVFQLSSGLINVIHS